MSNLIFTHPQNASTHAQSQYSQKHGSKLVIKPHLSTKKKIHTKELMLFWSLFDFADESGGFGFRFRPSFRTGNGHYVQTGVSGPLRGSARRSTSPSRGLLLLEKQSQMTIQKSSRPCTRPARRQE